MIELDPLLDALAKAEVPAALGMIQPQVMAAVAARHEASARRRTLVAVTVAALGLGAVGSALPRHGEAAADVQLAEPLALAPSHLLAADL